MSRRSSRSHRNSRRERDDRYERDDRDNDDRGRHHRQRRDEDSGNDDANLLIGGGRSDKLSGRGGDDVLLGEGGNDRLHGGAGKDLLDGGTGNDRLYGGSGDDQIDGGEGCDLVSGGCGDDQIDGGAGNDRLYGGSGDDQIDGGEGCDLVSGGCGDDEIDGGAGNDWLFGGFGDDQLDGGEGRDKLFGGFGDDTLDGGEGRDKLFGGFGDDKLNGGADGDRLYGGFGDDMVQGGAGSDRVYGGFGRDLGIYDAASNVGARDHYDGGFGFDTLHLELTREQWLDGQVQDDIARFLQSLEGAGRWCGGFGKTFRFEAFDLTARNWEALSVSVDGVPLDPRDEAVDAVDDAFAVGEGERIEGNVLDNDLVPDLVRGVTLVDGPAAGVVRFNADGSFSFDTAGGFDSLADGETTTVSFSYRVEDADGDADTATATVTVTGKGAPAVTARDDSAQGDENQVLRIDVLANDSPGLTLDSASIATAARATGAAGGSVSIDGDQLVFDPGSDFDDLAEGETTTVTVDYTALAADGTPVSAQAAITVTGSNDAPVLQVSSGAAVDEGAAVVLTPAMLNGSDVDGEDAALIYRVTGAPAQGWLELAGAPGLPITGFTQGQLAAGEVVYRHDGSEAPGDAFTFDLVDAAGDGPTGQTFAIAVDPVNDAPTVDVNAGASVAEGNSVVLSPVMLSGSDPDGADAELTYTVSGAPAHGRLELVAAPGVAIGSFTQTQLTAGEMVYVHDGSEESGDGFTFDLSDATGVGPTGQSFAIAVDPVNDAPVLDVNAGAQVDEGGSLVLSLVMLSASDVDDTAADLTYSLTAAPAHGRLELASAPGETATAFTQAQLAAGEVVYVHDGGEETADGFSFDLSDAAGAGPTGLSFGIEVLAANDAPEVIVNTPASVAEGGSFVIDSNMLSGFDPDGSDDELTFTLRAAPAHGRLELASAPGVAIGSFTQAQLAAGEVVYVHGGSEEASDSFSFDLSDVAGAGPTGQSFAIAVDPVNDAPVLDVNAGAQVDEGGSLVLSPAMLSASDVDDTAADLTYSVTGAPAHGQLELASAPGVAITGFIQSQLAAGEVVYVHDGGEEASDGFSFDLSDAAGAGPTDQTFGIEVLAVNDAPTVDVNAGGTVDEGGSLVLAPSLLAASDPDGSDLELTYSVTGAPAHGRLELASAPGVAITSFTQAQLAAGEVVYLHDGSEESGDGFTFDLSDAAGAGPTGQSFAIAVDPVNDAPTLAVNAGAMVDEGGSVVLTTTMLNATDVDDLPSDLSYAVTGTPGHGRIELIGSPGLAVTGFTQAQLTAGEVVYVHDGSEDSSDDFTFDLSDPSGAGPIGQSFGIEVLAANDAPEVAVNAGATVAEGASTVLSINMLSGFDPDGSETDLTFSLTTPPAHGRLELANAPGVAITSFTQAQLAASKVVYVHGGGEETADGFTFDLSDAAGAGPTGQNFAIAVDPVNDAPTLDVNAGAQVDEGGSLVLSPAMLSASDVDDLPAGLSYSVTAAPAHGRLELAGASGVAVTAFTQAQLAAGEVVYVHGGGEEANDGFTFDLRDPSGAGPTGQSFGIEVLAVNDAPQVNVNLGATVTEGGSLVLSPAMLSGSDPDGGDSELTYSVGGLAHGRLELAAAPGVAIGSFTQAQLAAGEVVYVHDGSEQSSDGFSFALTDAAGAGPTGQGFAITVDPVNDAPSLDVNAGGTVEEGGVLVLGTAMLRAADPDDGDAALTYTVTGAPAHGRLELVGAPGVAVSTFSQAQLAAGELRYVHDGSEEAADGFTFDVTDAAGAAVTGERFDFAVTPVNDAPVIDVNAGATVSEGGMVVLTTAMLSGSDVDDLPDSLTYALGEVPDHGRVALAAAPGVAVTAFTQAQLAAGDVVYIHDGGEQASDGFTFDLSDAAGAGPTGQSFAIAVDPVNDAPTLDVNVGATVDQGAAVVLSTAMLSGSDVDDAPADLTYSVTTAPAHGRLELAGVPGEAITSFTQAQLAAGEVVYVHDGGPALPDSLGFALSDDDGAGPTALEFAITVNRVNAAPTAQDLAFGGLVEDGAAQTFAFVGDDPDPDDDPMTITFLVTRQPVEGAVINNGDGTFTFDPDGDFQDLDAGETREVTFTYVSRDSYGAVSDPATVTVTVTGTADAPVSPPNFSLGDLDGSNGFQMIGGTAERSGISLSGAGDINGDGFDDVIVGAPLSDNNGAASGNAYVVYGRAGGFDATLALTALDGSTGFRLIGAKVDDQAGAAVSAAGDVNGDGIDDLIVGAFGADPNGQTSGSSYVLYGTQAGFDAAVNLADIDGSNGLRIDGVKPDDRSSAAVSHAGDVNGDGYDDLIVGARFADPNGTSSGSSYVVFGGPGLGASVALGDLDGSNGFRLDGGLRGDQAGHSVGGAGDVNGDGYDDLVVGAFGADPNGSVSGAAYVVFGAGAGFAADLDLSTLDGSNGFQVFGAAGADQAGWSVSGVGDVNGDGFDDVVLGARLADPNGNDSGAAYVIFGKAEGFDATLDLSALDGRNGFRLEGVKTGDQTGIAVSAAGDVDADGFDDLIVGASLADPSGNASGASYVVFGAGGFAASLDLNSLNGSKGFRLDGAQAGGEMGGSVAAGGDVNGDGFDDLLLGVSRALSTAGVSYLYFGDDFTGAVSQLGDATDEVLVGTAGRDNLLGAQGDDELLGLDGRDRLNGGAGNDLIDGGGGNDLLRGGAGDDLFVFAPGGGGDVIEDFDAGAGTADRIDVRGYGFSGLSDILARGAESQGDSFIEFAPGDTLTLLDLRLTELHADDFIFG